MSSLQMHEKISIAEAIQWIENIHDSYKESGIPTDLGDLSALYTTLKPIGFKAPRKPRVSKGSSSVSDRAESEYDESKCQASIWLKGGYRGQCSCKKFDGGFLCTRHQTEADKHDGMVKNGMYNEERPSHHYGEIDNPKALIPWHDVVIEKKIKKEKNTSGTKKSRCCSHCHVAGHTKSKCPDLLSTSKSSKPLSAQQLREMLAAAEKSESGSEEPSEGLSLNGAGVGDLEEDTSVVSSIVHEIVEQCVEQTAETISIASCREMQREKTLAILGSHSDTDKTDNDDSVTEINFQGVDYTIDDENTVYDDECDSIGTWDGSDITFNSKKDEKLHKSAVKML